MIFWAAPQPHTTATQKGHPQSLVGSDGMDCGHESLHNARVVMGDLSQKGQAVGDAGGIADSLKGVVILLMVHAHQKHEASAERGRDDDPLGLTLQVSSGLLSGSKDPSGLDSTTYSTPTSPHLMLEGSCSWKMEMSFPFTTNFLF